MRDVDVTLEEAPWFLGYGTARRAAMSLRITATALLFASACAGSTEPVIAHIMVLQTIAGDPLPAAEHVNTACGTLLVADTIVLYEGGTGERRTVRDVPSWSGAVDPVTCEPAASSPRRRDVSHAELTYQLAADVVEIDFPCRDVASCIPSPHFSGTLSSQGLVLETAQFSRSPLVYVPLAAP